MSDTLASRLFRPEVLQMSSYHVAQAQDLIKLDAMENPYSWPVDAIESWSEQIKSCQLNRYPDPQAKSLTAALANLYQFPARTGVLLGNGSDELIQILLMALPAGSCVLAPEPGFVMYRQIARSLGLAYHSVSLNDDFSLDIDQMLDAIDRYQPAIVFLAYPNNPTGNLFADADIDSILNCAPGLVVVDEAYAPFTDRSYLDKLPSFSNLVVMRTLSKLGLAGLRLGFICADQALIDQYDKVRLPYNINTLSQLTANFALQHKEFLDEQTQAIRAQRSWLLNQLGELAGIECFPSSANFVLFKSLAIAADDIFAALLSQGILIKNLSPQGGLLTNCLRVTVGTPTENQAFIQALTRSLPKEPHGR